MSLISKQVDDLIDTANEIELSTDSLIVKLREAANTINMLSQKCRQNNIRNLRDRHNGWIPCSERMPKEHESMYAGYYGTDDWKDSFWKTESYLVLVTIEYPDGQREIDELKTHDGKWFFIDIFSAPRKRVISWMPMLLPDNRYFNDEESEEDEKDIGKDDSDINH